MKMRKEKKIVAGEKYFKNRMNRRLTHFLFRKKKLISPILTSVHLLSWSGQILAEQSDTDV